MHWERVQVSAYSGHRGEETPRVLMLDGKEIGVIKVLDRWIEENRATGGRKRCFKVKGSNFGTYLICYDEEKGCWFRSKTGSGGM